MKQKSSYVGHLHPKYLALTMMEAGISSEAGHKLLWLVNASGVLRSFPGNMGTTLALRDERQIHFASGMKNSQLTLNPLLTLLGFAFTQLP